MERVLVERLRAGKVVVRVKPNAKKTEILDSGEEVRVAVAAQAEDNKANVELVKFLSRLAGRRVKIVSGLTSKRKVVALA